MVTYSRGTVSIILIAVTQCGQFVIMSSISVLDVGVIRVGLVTC